MRVGEPGRDVHGRGLLVRAPEQLAGRRRPRRVRLHRAPVLRGVERIGGIIDVDLLRGDERRDDGAALGGSGGLGARAAAADARRAGGGAPGRALALPVLIPAPSEAGVSWRPGKGEPETAAGSGFGFERLEAGAWGAPLGGGRGLAARGDRRQPVHLFLLRSEMRLHKPAAP